MTKAKTTEGTTPPVKSSKQVMVIILIFLSVILFIAITIIWFKSKSKSDENLSKQEQTETIPSMYTEYHTLKEGKIIRVNIPSGYKCDYYGGGKKYYHQAQNSKKEIWGGGNCPTGLGNPNASYADLSYYNEEITVMCKFKRKF